MDYYGLDARALGKGAKIPIVKLGSSGEVFCELALQMLQVIESNSAQSRPTVLICPVGPVGQYPLFVRLVNARRVSLRNCWFFNMDEYLQDDGTPIDPRSPLSFRGFMQREVYDKLDPALCPPEEQRVFPDPRVPQRTDRLLTQLGDADITFGGIGINGHLAFNEAEEGRDVAEFAALGTRVVRLSPETRTTNAIGERGGAIDAMPRLAVTLGMRQILSARQVRLGVFREWHRAVVRRAAYGEVSAAFPATLLQNHPDARIYCNDVAAAPPFSA